MWLSAAVVSLISMLVFWDKVPAMVKSYIAAMGSSIFVSYLYDPYSRLAYRKLGLNVEPNFMEPHKSESLGEFWSFRWNYMAAKSLRDTVYSPIMEGRLVQPENEYHDTLFEQKVNHNKRNPVK